MSPMKFFSLLIIFCSLLSCSQMEERILFSSSRNGNSDIFLMKPDGSEITSITKSEAEEWGPVWVSQTEISFLRQQDERIDLVKLDLVTGEETLLQHPPNCLIDDKNFVYNSKGTSALYVCDGNVYQLSPDFERPKNLTMNMTGRAAYVDWAGREKFVFTSNAAGNNNIYTMGLGYASSYEPIRLTLGDSNDERASISPDGWLMVYSSDQFEKGNQDIVLMDLTNGKVTNLSQSPGTELIARWSQNGEKVYYGSNKDGNWELYSYTLASGETIRLTTNEAFDGDPRIFNNHN